MKHLDEATLYEVCFLPEDPTARQHLDDCKRCSDRLARLRENLDLTVRVMHDSVDRKPETFWTRQSLTIQRRIKQRATKPAAPAFRIRASLAAAATIAALVTGASFVYRTVAGPEPITLAAESTLEPAAPVEFIDHDAEELSMLLFEEDSGSDPWESGEIAAFGDLVEWESWLEEDITSLGGTS